MSKTKTLIAYFSKTGNTRQIAEKARDSIKCDIDEIAYDSQTKKIVWSRNPADSCALFGLSICRNPCPCT